MMARRVASGRSSGEVRRKPRLCSQRWSHQEHALGSFVEAVGSTGMTPDHLMQSFNSSIGLNPRSPAAFGRESRQLSCISPQETTAEQSVDRPKQGRASWASPRKSRSRIAPMRFGSARESQRAGKMSSGRSLSKSCGTKTNLTLSARQIPCEALDRKHHSAGAVALKKEAKTREHPHSRSWLSGASQYPKPPYPAQKQPMPVQRAQWILGRIRADAGAGRLV